MAFTSFISTGSLALAALVCVGTFIVRYFSIEQDSAEPLYLSSKIPVMGHVLGIFLQKQ